MVRRVSGQKKANKMEALSFQKLEKLKQVIGRMSLSTKMEFIAAVSGKLKPESLITSDGRRFSEENILAVGLIASVADNIREFESIGGFYGGGYKSELRKGLYHNQGGIPNSEWRKGIRKLYHHTKGIMADVALPVFESNIPENAWAESRF